MKVNTDTFVSGFKFTLENGFPVEVKEVSRVVENNRLIVHLAYLSEDKSTCKFTTVFSASFEVYGDEVILEGCSSI